jgi:endoglucanase
MLTPSLGRRGWRTAALAAVTTASLLSAAACAPASGAQASSGAPAAAVTPTRLYAYPGGPLSAAAAAAKAAGHRSEAAVLKELARTPSGIWLAGEPYDIAEARRVTLAAARARAIPVIVAYNLPDRDACGKLSTAPRRTAAGYEQWISRLAAAIGTGHDIVIVEPDGLPDIVRGCLSPAQARVRYGLLRYAMRRLGALPHARVYLDAGNPGMFGDPAQLVGPLERAGIRYGRGFSANVSNFQWTADAVTWSQQLEHALGGRVGAVIDTSRNGNGPYTGADAPQWCNPPGRALGPAPRLDPGPAGIDAYLWVKDPGASDGRCNGGPAAGQFWPEYAVGLARAMDHP